MSNISMFRGDSKTFNFKFTDSDGSALDITGHTIFFTVKPNIDDDSTDSSAVIKKDITSHYNAEAGESQLTISSDDSNVDAKNYVYDIQLKDASGNIHTPNGFPARFIIKEDVTRRES